MTNESNRNNNNNVRGPKKSRFRFIALSLSRTATEPTCPPFGHSSENSTATTASGLDNDMVSNWVYIYVYDKEED